MLLPDFSCACGIFCPGRAVTIPAANYRPDCYGSCAGGVYNVSSIPWIGYGLNQAFTGSGAYMVNKNNKASTV